MFQTFTAKIHIEMTQPLIEPAGTTFSQHTHWDALVRFLPIYCYYIVLGLFFKCKYYFKISPKIFLCVVSSLIVFKTLSKRDISKWIIEMDLSLDLYAIQNSHIFKKKQWQPSRIFTVDLGLGWSDTASKVGFCVEQLYIV